LAFDDDVIDLIVTHCAFYICTPGGSMTEFVTEERVGSTKVMGSEEVGQEISISLLLRLPLP